MRKRNFSDSEGEDDGDGPFSNPRGDATDWETDSRTDQTKVICVAPERFVVKRQPMETPVVLTKRSEVYGDFRASLGHMMSTFAYDGIKGEELVAAVYFSENGVEKKILTENPVIPMQVSFYKPRSDDESGTGGGGSTVKSFKNTEKGASSTMKEEGFVVKNTYTKEVTWYLRDVRNDVEWKHDSLLAYVTEPQLEKSKGRMVFGHPALAGFTRDVPILPIELEFSATGSDEVDTESSFWSAELEKGKKWVHMSFRRFENESVRMLASFGTLESTEGYTVIPRS